MALNGYCCAIKFEATANGPKRKSESAESPRQRLSNHCVEMHITALVRPKPNMARLTTSEPKCAQLPTAKNPHDGNLQRNDRACDQADGAVERQRSARAETVGSG